MSKTPWLVVGGSATGSSHVRSAIECQDAHAWFARDPDIYCYAVADGAGSRKHSARGAAAAVTAAVQLVRGAARWTTPAAQVGVADIFEAARQRLDELALETNIEVGQFATTLAIVLVRDGTLEVGQIGDSIVVLETCDGAIVAVSPAERLEYVNETVFITSPEWLNHLRTDHFPVSAASGVALSTDGLRFKILDNLNTGEPYTAFFEDVFAYARSGSATSEAVAQFIDGLDDQSGDDKTLVVAVADITNAHISSKRETIVVNDFIITSDDLRRRHSDVGNVEKSGNSP